MTRFAKLRRPRASALLSIAMVVQLGGGAGAARAATLVNVPTDYSTVQARVDAAASQLVADPPELDPTFGTGGKLVAGFGSTILGMVVQADGKIVAVGAGADVVRFTTTGALDTTFDGDGHASLLVANPYDVAIDGNGKIVVVGTNTPGGYCCEVAVARYNSDGTPDATFDGDGVATALYGTPDAFSAQTVAITTGNKILVGGSTRIAQFTSTGTLDATFGTGGVATTGSSWITDIALQGDGKIVAVGGTSGLDFGIARFTSAGVLDPAFGGDGLVTTDLGGNDAANGVAIQGDGRIVVAGTAAEHFIVVRYDSTGALDPSFGGDGSVSTLFTGENIENANSVSIQADGKIVAVGRAFHDYSGEWAIARYATDGWLDGRMVTDFDKSTDTATVVAIQSNGRILVAGGQGGCETVCSWTMARYTGVTPLKTLAASPTSVDFGTVTIGAAPKSASVTITNTGSTDVIVSQVASTGTAAGASVTGETCTGAPVAARATCSVQLSFVPGSAGTLAAELDVQSDVDGSPLVVPLAGNAVAPPSGVTWGSTYTAGPPYTWNAGASLARTVQSGTQRLHLVYATDRIGSSWAKDTGPYAGVYYVRRSGSSWTTPKRINPSTQHAEEVGLAAAGSRVYVVWASQTRIIRYSPAAPRVLYVRVNTNYGGATSWRSIVRLSSTSGRIDFPTVAASLDDAHIAWTDSNTGAIKLASSRDRGVTWKTTTLGATTLTTTDGRSGVPSVGVWGSTVAVAWLADGAGTVKARVSTNRGVSWGPIVTIGNGGNSAVSVAVRGSRIAVAWTTVDDVLVNQNQAGVWGTAVVVSALPSGGPTFPYGAAVALQDPNRIAVSWAETRTTAHYVDLRWAESANGGSLWFQPQTLASASSSSARRGNSWPSIVWPAAGTRYVVWNGWTYNTNNYRLYLRAGSGTPIGPSSAATAWTTTAPSGIPSEDPGSRVSVGSRTGPGARVQGP